MAQVKASNVVLKLDNSARGKTSLRGHRQAHYFSMCHSFHATWLEISLKRLQAVERQDSGEAALEPERHTSLVAELSITLQPTLPARKQLPLPAG